jgi:hypothetical protein
VKGEALAGMTDFSLKFHAFYRCWRTACSTQDVASFEETQETLALLKLLALGQQDVAAGRVKPVADVVARLRARRADAWYTAAGALSHGPQSIRLWPFRGSPHTQC